MRTISIRQPVVDALLEKGAVMLGKGWPPTVAQGQYLPDVLGPVGIQVSTQLGGNKVGALTMRATMDAYDLLAKAPKQDRAPLGHVVAKAQVIRVLPGCWPLEETWKFVHKGLREAGIEDPSEWWVRGWMHVFPSPRWYWVIANVERVRPFKWKGVMSQFPVPDNLFRPVSTIR